VAKDYATNYVVECYWPSVSEDKVGIAAKAVQAASDELRRQGRHVRFVGSIIIPVEETVFFLLDGQEADVRAVSVRAAVPFERVLESLRIDGGPPDQDKPLRAVADQ
jgi:hypothetical protein